MEEFIDLYRYLAKCLVEIDSLEISNLAELIKKLNPLVASEKSGKILVDMLVVSIETSDKEKIKASLKLAMSSILKLEVAFGNEPSNHEEQTVSSDKEDKEGKQEEASDKEAVSSDKGRHPLNLLDSTILATYGTYKVWRKIFEYIWKKLNPKFTTSDIAPLIQEFYQEHLDKDLTPPTARAYAGAYVKYMVEEKLVSDEGDFSYVKLAQNDEKEAEFGNCPKCGGRMVKTGGGYNDRQRYECVKCGKKITDPVTIAKTSEPKDTKETKELKQFGESIDGDKENLTSVEPELPEEQNEFEQFQDRILEAAKAKHWSKVKIEEIEKAFKGTKSPEQVEKALVRLLVKEEIVQYPPEPKDLISAEEHDEPKPKGYIVFLSKI